MIYQMRLACRLLRTHILHRSEDIAGDRYVGPYRGTGEPEVRNPQLAMAVEKQIRRFDIAMNDSTFMGMLQGFGRLDHELHDAADIISCLGRRDRSGDPRDPSERS